MAYDPKDVWGLVQYTKPHYFRKTIEKTADYEVVLVAFEAGQQTSIHDHGGSECVMRCLHGRFLESTFDITADGIWHYQGSGIIEANQVFHVSTVQHHQVTGLNRGGTILINFYSPPLPERNEDEEWAKKSAETLKEWGKENPY